MRFTVWGTYGYEGSKQLTGLFLSETDAKRYADEKDQTVIALELRTPDMDAD